MKLIYPAPDIFYAVGWATVKGHRTCQKLQRLAVYACGGDLTGALSARLNSYRLSAPPSPPSSSVAAAAKSTIYLTFWCRLTQVDPEEEEEDFA